MLLRTTAFPPSRNSTPLLALNVAQSSAAYHPPYTSKTLLSVISSSSPVDSRFTFCFKGRVVLASLQQFQHPHVNLRLTCGNGFGVGAQKKRGKGGVGLMEVEMDDFDDEEDSDYDNENFGGDNDEDDDEGVLLPFEQLTKWLKNKPRGFGEGKVYDTSIEDKLLDEMRQSREAQAANVDKLKSNPINPNKNVQKKKVPEVVPSGVRVRLVNLPRKKNIHRDLKLAFHGIPGILDIIPAVSGNKKTRDPVCKGFAFVDFKCEKDAARFVQLYSGQIITFGKVQKTIKCELLNAHSSASASLELSESIDTAPQLMFPPFEESPSEDFNTDDSTLSSWNGIPSYDSDDLGKQACTAEQPDGGENQEFAGALVGDDSVSVELRIDSEVNSLSSGQFDRNTTTEQNSYTKLKKENAPKKKVPAKDKAKKVPKLDVPGSAKRLKIREKAVLSDVFSKYGLKAAHTLKDT